MLSAPPVFSTCLGSTPLDWFRDPISPPPGGVFFYVLTGGNVCGEGTTDLDSDGFERSIAPCSPPVGEDTDADGIPDSSDNCVLTANPLQTDSNGDNIGNVCDADTNNDCVVNVIDLGLLKAVFFSGDADSDFNGDGVVNTIDLGIMKLSFFEAPGPSGLPNACSP